MSKQVEAKSPGSILWVELRFAWYLNILSRFGFKGALLCFRNWSNNTLLLKLLLAVYTFVRYQIYSGLFLELLTSFFHNSTLKHLLSIWFLTSITLVPIPDWPITSLARRSLPLKINWRHGCWRVHCAHTSCEASQGNHRLNIHVLQWSSSVDIQSSAFCSCL